MVQQAPYMNTVWNSVPYISDLIGYLVILSSQALQHSHIMVAFKFCFLLGSNRCYYLVEGLACSPGPWADTSTQYIAVCLPVSTGVDALPTIGILHFFKIQALGHLGYVYVRVCAWPDDVKERITCIRVGQKIYSRSLMSVTVNLTVYRQCCKTSDNLSAPLFFIWYSKYKFALWQKLLLYAMI